jgi:hypothetical protein
MRRRDVSTETAGTAALQMTSLLCAPQLGPVALCCRRAWSGGWPRGGPHQRWTARPSWPASTHEYQRPDAATNERTAPTNPPTNDTTDCSVTLLGSEPPTAIHAFCSATRRLQRSAFRVTQSIPSPPRPRLRPPSPVPPRPSTRLRRSSSSALLDDRPPPSFTPHRPALTSHHITSGPRTSIASVPDLQAGTTRTLVRARASSTWYSSCSDSWQNVSG